MELHHTDTIFKLLKKRAEIERNNHYSSALKTIGTHNKELAKFEATRFENAKPFGMYITFHHTEGYNKGLESFNAKAQRNL